MAIPAIVAGIGLVAGLLWLRRTPPSLLNRTALGPRAHRAHRRHGMIVFGRVLDALYTAVVEAVRAADPVARIDDPRPGRAEDLAP